MVEGKFKTGMSNPTALIAQEMSDDLEAALEQFATIAEDLKVVWLVWKFRVLACLPAAISAALRFPSVGCGLLFKSIPGFKIAGD